MGEIKHLGFLGGGQLSRMLVEALQKLRQNGETEAQEYCLIEDEQAPASQVTGQVYVGLPSGLQDLKAFLSRCDAVTFENEFISPNPLREAVAGSALMVRPSIANLEILQDKLSQKKLLKSLQIPTAKFTMFSHRQAAENIFGRDFILKWSRLGYDGKGVLFVSSKTSDQTIEGFLGEARKRNSPVFAEEKISFNRELAVVAARDITGQILVYPLVQSEQTNGVCEWVSSLGSIAEKKGLHEVEPWIRSLLNHLDYVGVLAMEVFQTYNGFFVNELAPRVHNTGHYSQLALTESQFDSHVRAVLGLPLKDFERKATYFGMMNLLGPKDKEFKTSQPSHVGLPENAQLYWYDKTLSKPGRKLGHINFIATNDEELLKTKENLMKFREKLWHSMGQ